MADKKIIKGDLVEHKTLDCGLGYASHRDEATGLRWVVWKTTTGHWQAGSYPTRELKLVGHQSPAQSRMKL